MEERERKRDIELKYDKISDNYAISLKIQNLATIF